MSTRFLALAILLVTLGSAQASMAGVETAASPACVVRLLSPETIKKFTENFLSRTTGALAKSEDLSDAVELTRELLEGAANGDFEVKLVEGLQGNFALHLGYPANHEGLRPRVRTLELSPRAANALFRAGHTAPLDAVLVKEWVVAIAEVYPEVEFSNGRLKLEDVNLFTVLETKTRWLDALARMGEGDPVEPLSDLETAELFWPAISGAVAAGDLRKVVMWLGLAQYNRVGADPRALRLELKGPRAARDDSFKIALLDLGAQAANVFAAHSLVEEPGIAEAFDVSAEQAKELEALARARFDKVWLVLQRIFKGSK